MSILNPKHMFTCDTGMISPFSTPVTVHAMQLCYCFTDTNIKTTIAQYKSYSPATRV